MPRTKRLSNGWMNRNIGTKGNDFNQSLLAELRGCLPKESSTQETLQGIYGYREAYQILNNILLMLAQ